MLIVIPYSSNFFVKESSSQGSGGEDTERIHKHQNYWRLNLEVIQEKGTAQSPGVLTYDWTKDEGRSLKSKLVSIILLGCCGTQPASLS